MDCYLDGLPSLANTLLAILKYIMLLVHYTQKNTRRTKPRDTWYWEPRTLPKY